MENKFFTFFNSFFAYIDQGKLFRKPFSWLYCIFAIANLLMPIGVLVKLINSGLFQYLGGKEIVGIVLIWFVLAFAGWFGFQLWWNRMPKASSLTADSDDFVATPVVSHFIQTTGEWLGCFIGGLGCIGSLLATIFIGAEASSLGRAMGLSFLNFTAMGIILMPIYGFLIIVFFRYIAELARALASIANNTKK